MIVPNVAADAFLAVHHAMRIIGIDGNQPA